MWPTRAAWRRFLIGSTVRAARLPELFTSPACATTCSCLKSPPSGSKRCRVRKVSGSWVLHRLTRNRELDYFVLFSSIASGFGAAGQGSYGAANAFLDALALWRHAHALPGISINWGPWSGGGMAETLSPVYLRRMGVALLPPALGDRGA